MDDNFQDRTDEFLLHGDTMPKEEKARFLSEIEEDAEKKEHYEFTKSVKDAMASRGEKLKAMDEFRTEMKSRGHRKVLMLVSGIAAILVVGFFVIGPSLVNNSHDGNVRGGDDVFEITAPTDSITKDSIATDTTSSSHKN